MERASDIERFFQCLTCCHIENCNLDEKAEDKRGMCTEHSLEYGLKEKARVDMAEKRMFSREVVESDDLMEVEE